MPAQLENAVQRYRTHSRKQAHHRRRGVSRIDSAGLGALMACYSHAVRNRGLLKLLNPSSEVQNLLRMTKIDSLLQSFSDERNALRSFE